MSKLYPVKPTLKVCEWSPEQGGAYIAFDEGVDIPGLEGASITMRFERNNSFEEVQELVRLLQSRGFTFAVQK